MDPVQDFDESKIASTAEVKVINCIQLLVFLTNMNP